MVKGFQCVETFDNLTKPPSKTKIMSSLPFNCLVCHILANQNRLSQYKNLPQDSIQKIVSIDSIEASSTNECIIKKEYNSLKKRIDTSLQLEKDKNAFSLIINQ